MANKSGSIEGPTLLVGPTSSRLFTPDEVFGVVANAYPTEEGSYRSIYLPSTILPASGGGAPSSGDAATHSPLQYGPVHGIHHALLRGGERDVLLLHTGTQIWELRWWDRSWYPLIAEAGVSEAQVTWQPHEPKANPWGTQFVSTPTGVVIIPQNSRPYFYDGTVVAPLGFSEAPAPPVGLGPESTVSNWVSNASTGGINDSGYVVHGLPGRPGAMDEHMGGPRIGSLYSSDAIREAETDASHAGGYLLPGRWRCRVQYIDIWGNLSPLSGESNDVSCQRQPSMYFDTIGSTSKWVTPDKARRQIAWDGISPGPQHTRGRILYRTKDLENSGDSNYYELPINAAAVPGAFATLPDRGTETYPDNIPDAWLVNRPLEVDPVPMFRLGELAFGRLWVANEEGDEGMLRPSEVGRWGTFPRGLKMYPDPRAAQITGLHAVDGGLLVFTEHSCFMVVENADGDGFRATTLSTTAGCVAPSSIATMRDGMTVWLGFDGFYGYRGGEVTFLFAHHRRWAKRFNSARYGFSSALYDHEAGQYQCWVPVDGSLQPNRRYKFDGQHWHHDSFDGTVSMRGVCVTEDHRRIQIGCGTIASDTGVWVLDRGGPVQTFTVRTGWIRAMRSNTKAHIRRVSLWLRETTSKSTTSSDNILVKVRRNWRAEVVDTHTVSPSPDVHASRTYYEPNPTFWPVTLGADQDNPPVIRRRRPFWASVDINVSHAEVFQLAIKCPRSMEIMGLQISEVPSSDGGASARR